MVETKTTVTCDWCGKDLSDCKVVKDYSVKESKVKTWTRVVITTAPYTMNPQGTPYPTKNPTKTITLDLCDECYGEFCNVMYKEVQND